MLRGATSRHGTIRQVFVFLYNLRVFLRVYLRALALSFLHFASLFFLWFLLFWTDVAWSNVSSRHPAAKQTLIWTLSKAFNPPLPPHTHTRRGFVQAEPHNTPYHLPYHQPFVLSAILVSAMPTGNTVIMLIEMAGGSGLTLTAIIFLEPICTTSPPPFYPPRLPPSLHSQR